jgi:hypothetical protein
MFLLTEMLQLRIRSRYNKFHSLCVRFFAASLDNLFETQTSHSPKAKFILFPAFTNMVIKTATLAVHVTLLK